jgi:hypothetical protein
VGEQDPAEPRAVVAGGVKLLAHGCLEIMRGPPERREHLDVFLGANTETGVDEEIPLGMLDKHGRRREVTPVVERSSP